MVVASTREHLENALFYLRKDRLNMVENELENALNHYLIETEGIEYDRTSSIEKSI
jgi:hypothetical protein